VTTVSVAEIVRAAVDSCQPLINESKHRLRVSMPDDPGFVEGDVTRLAQILSNLLDNACKFTPLGGNVSLSVANTDSEVRFPIRDSGIGVSPEALSRVFNIYFQGEPPPGAELKGLGIGLALVRQLTDMHGGTVEARSDGLGKGSEFIVRLPLATVRSRPDSARVDASAATVRSVAENGSLDGC